MLTATPSRRRWQGQWADLLAAALLLGVCLAFYLPRATWPVSAQDEGILLVYPALVNDGALPYRDFAALYTPGGIYLLALAFRLFGESLMVERAVGLLYWWVMALALYFLGRAVSRLTGCVAAGAVLIGLVFFPAGAYAVVGALALVLWTLLAGWRACAAPEGRARDRLALLAGLGAGATLWFRQDVGVLASLALAAMLLPLAPRLLLRCALGGALLALPLFALLYAAGPALSFESLVLDVLRNGPGRRLPLQAGGALAALFLVVALVAAAAVIAQVKRYSPAERALLRGAAVLAVGLMPSLLQRADGWHIIYVASPVLGLAIVAAGIVLSHVDPRIAALRLSGAGAAGAALLLAGLLGYSAMRMKATVAVGSGDRQVHLVRHPGAGDLQRLVDEVNRIARPGWRVFTGPNDLRYTNYNDSYLYFLFPQLQPASRFVEMNPGVSNREGAGLAQQLATADIVILNSSYDNWREPNASSIAGSAQANRVVAQRFCEHRSFGHWRILLRCAPRP